MASGLSVGVAVPALAPIDGLQDPAFGVAGRVHVDLTSVTPAGALLDRVAQAPSGVLYLGGSLPTGHIVIARTSANGVRDTGFGTLGLARARPVNDASSIYALEDMVVLADGKPLVVGFASSNANNDIAICRYNVAGNLDASFGGDGCQRIALDLVPGGDELATKVVVLPDGKFMLAGYADTPAFNGGDNTAFLMRLNADGTLDTSFANVGYRLLNVLNRSTTALGLVRAADGSLYLHGIYRQVNSEFRFDRFVARYSSAGALLGSFGNSGIATVGFDDFAPTPSADLAGDLLIDSQGRLYDCGSSRTDGPLLVTVSVARYLPNGQLDASFGTGGRIYRTYNDLNAVSFVRGCTLQNDRLVAALHTGGVDFSYELALMRFLEDGSTDPSFGAGGGMTYPIDIGGNGIGHEASVRVLPQGDNLIVYGSASPVNGCCTEPYGFVAVRALTDRMFRDGFED
jgi:uncharacterized delta-60 repeat protein